MAKKRKSKNKSFLQKLIYIFLAIILVYSVLHYLGLTQEFDTKVQNALNKASSYTEQIAQPQQELPKPDASETSVTKEASSKQTAQDSEQNTHKSAKTDAPLLEGNDSYRASSVEIPLCPATMTKGSDVPGHEVHTYAGFELCYREDYEDSEWVAYTITREKLVSVIKRTDDFRADTSITTGSATPADYKASGYDRGHLAPAADMQWSSETMHESFLMSNMTPQAPQLNRGMWKELEENVRKWAQNFGEVTVVTGPVLEKPSAEYSSIGSNKVAVPEFFYKALLSKSNNGDTIMAAFIMPNKKCEGEIWDYAVSVDEIEERTGIDFFSALDDSIENETEKNINLSEWKNCLN